MAFSGVASFFLLCLAIFAFQVTSSRMYKMGNDQTLFSPGNDQTMFLPENDQTLFSRKNDQTMFSSGNDQTLFSRKNDQTMFSPGNDQTMFSPGNDQIMFSPGNDQTLFSRKNDQTMFSLGNDQTLFSPGNDQTMFSPGNDQTLFSPKNDQTMFSPGNDQTLFSPGNDQTLFSQKNDQTLFSPGNDQTMFSPRNDQTMFSPGNDQTLFSRKNDQTLFSPGNDQTLFSRKNDQTLFSPGNDQTLFSPRPRNDETLFSPRNDQTLFSPRNDQTVFSPQNDQTVFSPQNDQTLFSPQNDQTLFKPRAAKVNSRNPILDMFIKMEDLKLGGKLPVYFPGPVKAPLLSKEEAQKLPTKLPEALEYFGFLEGSEDAKAVEKTMAHCQASSIEGEVKFCAATLDSLLQSAKPFFGNLGDVKATSTKVMPKDFSDLLQNYTVVEEPKVVTVHKMMGCHVLQYPSMLYFCHGQESENKLFKASLVGENGWRFEAVGICHMDTSEWSPKHPVFEKMQTSPGKGPLCHFFPAQNLIFFPSKINL